MQLFLAFRILLFLLLPVSVFAQSIADEVEQGRRIYLDGILPSGAPLTGTRFSNSIVSGAEAACVNCHRRSGMGQVEGDILVQPITGNFLFASGNDKPRATMDPRVSKSFNQSHDPYTDSDFANAIVRGINNHKLEMSAAMPRFSLSADDLRALKAYLAQLSAQWSPGVSGNTIHFATVITPDVAPEQRKAYIDMMRTIFRQKNGSTVAATKPGAARHHMVSAAEFVLGTERNWTLDIWELSGAPDSWSEQLQTHYRSQPVFALVSGLSHSTWQPVHDFCEHEQVPCWFPSVDLPVISQSQYSVYFTGGVLLEADVMAKHLLDQPVPARRLVQVYHNDEAARAAASELAHDLAGSNIPVENLVLRSGDSLHKTLGKINPSDTVMFWLRSEEMAELSNIKPISGNNYFSAILAHAEHAPLKAEWKAKSKLVYPYELPEKRKLNLDYFYAWLNISKQPLIDEVMQSQSFFALNFLTDTVAEMLDNLYRDYLLERAEIMLNKREDRKSEQETRDRRALGRPGDLEKKHGTLTIVEAERIQIPHKENLSNLNHGTTVYPHLSLGAGQRFASKGGYIVKFADTKGDTLIPESSWIVP